VQTADMTCESIFTQCGGHTDIHRHTQSPDRAAR